MERQSVIADCRESLVRRDFLSSFFPTLAIHLNCWLQLHLKQSVLGRRTTFLLASAENKFFSYVTPSCSHCLDLCPSPQTPQWPSLYFKTPRASSWSHVHSSLKDFISHKFFFHCIGVREEMCRQCLSNPHESVLPFTHQEPNTSTTVTHVSRSKT